MRFEVPVAVSYPVGVSPSGFSATVVAAGQRIFDEKPVARHGGIAFQ
jgi:hypothetical protein